MIAARWEATHGFFQIADLVAIDHGFTLRIDEAIEAGHLEASQRPRSRDPNVPTF